MDQLAEILEKVADTKAFIIGEGAGERAAEMFRALFPGRTALVVADRNTRPIAKGIEAVLRKGGVSVEPAFVFEDPDLYAEWTFLNRLEDRLRGTEAVAVAVGSGVINDLTKLSSHHLGRRYMVCGTAASMDGYTASGASVTKDGNKQTFDCRAPKGILLDPAVAAAAPEGLSASGYADLLAKIPAGADWMIAAALGKDRMDRFAFEVLQGRLRQALAVPERLAAREVRATEALAEGLIMSGFAMQLVQSSRPASGIEHQYSHCWDIENLCIDGRHVSHGFKVGIGTLLSTAGMEFLLGYDMGRIDVERCVAQWPTWEEMQERIRRLAGHQEALRTRCLKETADKYTEKEALRGELRRFLECWPELREKVRRQIFTYDEVKLRLRKAGAPFEPEHIGISRERLRRTFRVVPYMRSRYMGIDLIDRLGLLPELEERLFGPGGRYELPPAGAASR